MKDNINPRLYLVQGASVVLRRTSTHLKKSNVKIANDIDSDDLLIGLFIDNDSETSVKKDIYNNSNTESKCESKGEVINEKMTSKVGIIRKPNKLNL